MPAAPKTEFPYDAVVELVQVLRNDTVLDNLPRGLGREKRVTRHAKAVAARYGVDVKELARTTADMISPGRGGMRPQ